MAKEKVKKELDYSRIPEHIWQKQLGEFIEFMNQLENQIYNCAKVARYIERCKEHEDRSVD